MQINYTVKNIAGSNKDHTCVITFDLLKERTRGIEEYRSINMDKLLEALKAGFRIVLPLGIEVQAL